MGAEMETTVIDLSAPKQYRRAIGASPTAELLDF